MFYSLTGNLIHVGASTAVIDCGGVGFKCAVSGTTLSQLPEKGAKITLYTHLHVREDALDLFGFFSEDELEYFKLLTSVSGVGAKGALSVLSVFSPDDLARTIADGDAKSLTRAQGIGAKIAQRMVLELKDKMGVLPPGGTDAKPAAHHLSVSNHAAEAVGALVSLGYSQSEASMTIARLDSALPVQDLIKEGLRRLSGNV